ncbi:Nucleolar MIF4G domain-containing protein 1 isoform 1 [Oopsacas minuta]|uniref:Nucleolar MIF4G domain-containing protein 1 isoform 1 n=1 Tax=Oopsacas minuta TaxID=111878 RepID=A0AAV7K6S6_9METZ|nr:Nucleolar MIF4G domain-containing protein 1 isoform 1 [Oopsacas minuta]
MPNKIRRKIIRKQVRKQKKQLKHGKYLEKAKPRKKQAPRPEVKKIRNTINTGKLVTQEDSEIIQLEKKLNLSNKKSLPDSFYDEGLGFILDYKTDVSREDLCSESSDVSVSEDYCSSFSEVESEVSLETPQHIVKEKPTKQTPNKNQSNITEEIEFSPMPVQDPMINTTITRRVTGLINRLSKSNINYTAGQVLQLYQDNSAHDMNECISCVLTRACLQDVIVPERLAIECMLLLAIAQGKIITANQLGSYFIVTSIKQFDTNYNDTTELSFSSKLCHNIARCLSYLYSFKVLTSVLIYDVIRKLVTDCSTLDVELLLIILKTVGLDIRKEDPQSMKDIILEIQGKRKQMEERIDDSRVVWMLDTINAIKTNNHRKIPNYDPGKLEEYNKILKAANTTDVSPFNMQYDDVIKVDEHAMSRLLGIVGRDNNIESKNGINSKEMVVFTKLMQQQRMNTDIRRKIFTVLMTSSDYIEAINNLVKLDITKIQRREIPKIIVECCIQENPFNLYYAYLSQRLCNSGRENQITFQYTLWDKIKNLSEMTHVQTTNFIKLIIRLVQAKSLSISILKVISFNEIDKVTTKFLKKVLSAIIFELSEDSIVSIFQGLKGKDHLQNFRYSLSLFVKHLMKSEDPVRIRRVSIMQNAMGMSYLIKN